MLKQGNIGILLQNNYMFIKTQTKMKKVLLSMTLLIGMTAVMLVLSSFTAPKQETTEISVMSLVNAPVYWEGYAHLYGDPAWNKRIYIKVYRTEGQCNSFYAVLTGGEMSLDDDIGREFWVKEGRSPYGDYYVTYRNGNYHFGM